MYLEHFGLREAPFRLTPHTDFFFAGANRGATLEALCYAITHDEGIVKVSGDVGSGKSLFCRMLMERLPPSVISIYLSNPTLSRNDILFSIAVDLGLSMTAKTRPSTLLASLREHLTALNEQGRTVVILVDEANAMAEESLEGIRLLSNLESNNRKLLQLVLFGQPELNAILRRPDMRQLKERITHNFSLDPLGQSEISAYLDFRIRSAGYKGPNLFSPSAIKLITLASHGLTRRINILADKALLSAYAAKSQQIGAREVRAAIRDAEFDVGPGRSWRINLATASLGAASVITLVVIALWNTQQGTVAAESTLPVHAAEAIPAAPVTITPAVVADTPPVAALNSAVPDVKSVVVTAPASTSWPWRELGPLTRQRALASQSWIASANGEHWFIQIVRGDITQSERVEKTLRLAQQHLDTEALRVYAVELDGSRRLGLVFGDYPTQEAAEEALRSLPEALANYKPFVRQIKRLR
jgi:type II secretory pathway predicted ATPase ExeA